MIWEFTDVVGRRLVAWGVLSVLLALPMLALGDAFWRGVGLQFALWGLVDAAIGVVARSLGERNRRRTIGDVAARDRELPRVRRLLLVNAALDVGYVALGAWLLAGAGDEAFRAGSGVGIILQGLFLLAFDLLHAAWVPAPGPLLPAAAPLFAGSEHEPFRLWRADPPDTREGDDHAATGTSRGALLVHGFGGSPAEMRTLAALLAANGWRVEVPRLPGHGPEIRDIADYGVEDWIRTVETAAVHLRSAGVTRLVVVGHSVGAALALGTAATLRPDALVLLAPFCWPTPAWQRVFGPIVRVFLPPGFRLFGRMDLADPEVRRGVEGFMPGLDLANSQVEAGLRQLRVPTRLFDQLFRVSALATGVAPSVRQPILALQGASDTVATPERTQRLLDRLPSAPRARVVEAEHDLLTDASPARDEVLGEILAFVRTIDGEAAGAPALAPGAAPAG